MNYSRFELLAVAVGGVAIACTILASLGSGLVLEEVVAQVMLLLVLIAAVHYGRNGGFVAAIGAIVVYLGMRSPLLASDLTPDVLRLVVLRTAAYGIIGIVGGEVCGRIKYVLVRLENGANVDDETTVYDAAYMSTLLTEALALHARYKAPMSAALFTLAPALTSDLRPARRRSLLRAVANHIRNGVRLVDDVGRLDEGCFMLLMPHTAKDGGEIAAERVRKGLCELLGARDESLSVRVLGAPEDLSELNELNESIRSGADEAA